MEASDLVDTAFVPLSRTAQEPGSQPSRQVVVSGPRPSELSALAKLEQASTTNAGSLLRPRHVRYHPYERPASWRVGRMEWAQDVDIAIPSLVPAGSGTATAAFATPIETPELHQPSQEVLESLRGPIVGTFNPVDAFGATQLPPSLPQPAPPSPRTVLVRQLQEEAQRSDCMSAFGHIWQQRVDRMANQPQLAERLPQNEPALLVPPPAPEPVVPEAPKSAPVVELEREEEPIPEGVLEEELAWELERELELDFEDVPIPAPTPSPATKPPSESARQHSEEEIEAALALQALSCGLEIFPKQGGDGRAGSNSGAVGRRVIKAPKSLKARVKAQRKPEREKIEPQAAPSKPSLPPGKIFDLSDVQEEELLADLADLWEGFEGFNAALPVAKKMNARKNR